MAVKIEETTREQVAEFLPLALKKTLNSYDAFMRKKISTDADEFSDHHKACKIAIAHIQLLLKLAEWANVQVESDENHADLMQIALNETKNIKFLDSQNIGEEG